MDVTAFQEKFIYKNRQWAGFEHQQYFASPCLTPVIDLYPIGTRYPSRTLI